MSESGFTAFEHAWSVSTHDLVYKASEVNWGRLRLAAQIKATVEQLDTLILTFDEAFKNVSKNKWPAVDDKKRIFDYIEMFKLKGYIPKECLPKDLSRFCDNLYKVLQNKENFNVINALQIIEEEISRTSNDLFPRSISLLQYFISILFKGGFLSKSGLKYYYHISEEVLQIYPELREIKLRFDYDAQNIPVLLSDAPHEPALPVFLRGMTWVDFRLQDPDPLQRLLWGVTGKRGLE